MPRNDDNRRFRTLHDESHPDLSTRGLKYPTVNHRRLVRANEMAEEVASEMQGGVQGGGLRGGKQAVFLPPTWAVSRCKLEVQLEVDSELAKDMFQVCICPREAGEKLHQF